MTITITLEDEQDGKRYIADRRVNALDVEYAIFDLVGDIIRELRTEIETQKKAESRPYA